MTKRDANLSRCVRPPQSSFRLVPFILSIPFLYNVSVRAQYPSHSELIKKSRESCVRVYVDSKKRAGSGFFVDPNLVVTCFHVVTDVRPVDPNTKKIDFTRWRPYPDIVVVTAEAEEIAAECISLPTLSDPFPFEYDFALLRLKTSPKAKYSTVSFCQDTGNLAVGDDMYFSGFPLGAPAMLTHKGMLSGFTKSQSVLCIQAPINKGNSGGAVLNGQGEVIGIISNREGGITGDLDQVRRTIGQMRGQNVISVEYEGVKIDYLQVDKGIINILDAYISTGIGYARNISYVRAYLQRHNLMKSGNREKGSSI